MINPDTRLRPGEQAQGLTPPVSPMGRTDSASQTHLWVNVEVPSPTLGPGHSWQGHSLQLQCLGSTLGPLP